ncbi:hypothetical protein QFZ58_002602 [Streptomyces sp. B1I3]|nr:hypothetical protein [Streptomyces sp. B1I3]
MGVRAGVRQAAVLAGAVLVVTGVLAGCDTTPDPTATSSGQLDWERCEAPEGGTAPGSEWRCATVDVPLDYAEPDGGTIGIALIRKEATRRGERLGSMLFNFGGPGGSGVGILPRAAAAYTGLNTRYDLVGFDPRGVAGSAGVRCRDDAEQEKAYREVDMTPDTAAEETAFVEDGADFGAGCLRLSGTVLPHVGTTTPPGTWTRSGGRSVTGS